MTALVSLSAGGAITGFSFVPQAAADISSPTSMPLNLVALKQSAQAAKPAANSDAMLRTAIVNVADYYLRMAQTKTPAEMEAIIWRHDSVDGVDHGQSCAAFASLTLELAAQVVGQQSWVSGGGSYPWPLHSWADVRVEPNPASLGITSIQQDAEAHHRWHPLGDGYRPQPGDWVLFDGHVEVITEDTGAVLHTVGGDSLPNFSVNAHEYPAPLATAGVIGFVDNGSLQAAQGGAPSAAPPPGQPAAGGKDARTAGGKSATTAAGPASAAEASPRASAGLAAIPGAGGTGSRKAAPRAAGDAVIPGLAVPAPRSGGSAGKAAGKPGTQAAARTHAPAAHEARVSRGDAAIPGLDVAAELAPGHHAAAYRRHHPSPARKPVAETRIQQAFISEVAPGAVEAQERFGVPAAVTIAQAIDESGWGQSQLAAQDHNLFGIKGTGPAGSVPLPTQEYVNGQPVSTSASFRVYHNVAESIEDHGRLLARSGYYQQAMAERQNPDKFAAALTGVYATDPNYGANLISLMRRYDLYRYGEAGHSQARRAAAPAASSASIPGLPGAAPAPAGPAGSAPPPSARPQPTRTAQPEPTRTGRPQPTPTSSPEPTRTASPEPTGTASPEPTRTASPRPTGTASPRPTGTAGPRPTGTASPRPSRTGSPQPRTAQPRTAQPRTAQPRPPQPRPAQPRTAQPRTAQPRPGSPAATPSPARSRPTAAPSAAPSQADIPGVTTESESDRPMTSAVSFGPGARFVPVTRSTRARPAPAPSTSSTPSTASTRSTSSTRSAASARSVPKPRSASGRSRPATARLVSTRRYRAPMPRSVLNSFVETAKGPLLSEETLYRDVASFRGISWQVLAACDWMQCDARPRRSPVYGERLGTRNVDGTVYTSKSAALARCADDLVRLAHSVYGIDLTGGRDLSVRDLANAFAAFRWGGLLKAHDCSAMEFPYSVAGLTEHHLGMRWPRIPAPGTGDRPGGRFRRSFGAVPIVLGLDYPATV
jgi:flagellum-specific peptidoglycan hydrolase FlgJ